MGIKNRIRRAFTAGKNDGLSRLMEDCPDKTQPDKPQRKRLSDRAVGIISTAASLALLIGAVFGGVSHFRNAFPNGIIQHGGSNSGSLNSPTDSDDLQQEPDGTDINMEDVPPSVDYENSVEGYITRTDDILYPLSMRDSIYEVPDIPVQWLVEYGMQKCRIVRNDRGYCIQFDFEITTGRLLSIDVLPCECEKEGLLTPYTASWIAMMDLAPEYYGSTQYVDYVFTFADDDTYLIRIDVPDASVFYHVSALTGQITHKETGPSDPFSPLLARDKALSLWGMALSEARSLQVFDNGDMYEVYWETGNGSYCVFVDAAVGSILYDGGMQEIAPPEWESLPHLIGWQQARDAALEACGRTLEELLGFACDYHQDDSVEMYRLEMRFADDAFEYYIDAVTGAFREAPEPVPDDKIGEDLAVLFAVEHTNHAAQYAAGAITDIAVKFDDTEEPCRYWVYYTVERTHYEVCVHAYNGQILLCSSWGQEIFYSEADAIQVAQQHASDAYQLRACVLLGIDASHSFYLVVFRSEATTLYVMVDSATLRLMDSYSVFPEDAITQNQAVGSVLEYLGLEDWEHHCTRLQGVYTDGSPFYCVILHEGDLKHIFVVDGTNGNITTDIDQTFDAPGE